MTFFFLNQISITQKTCVHLVTPPAGLMIHRKYPGLIYIMLKHELNPCMKTHFTDLASY